MPLASCVRNSPRSPAWASSRPTARVSPLSLDARNWAAIRSADTLTLLSTLPTLCNTLVAISAMPPRRAVVSSWA
ncbi:hypothetical protein D9M68_736800 [compost metagenome]